MSAAGRASVVLLDALGTLVWLTPPVPLLQAELARRLGVEVSEAQAAHALGAEIAYYRAHLNDGADEAGLADLRARCAEVLRAALPDRERLRAAGREQLTEVLLSALRFLAFPDAAPALAQARRCGCACVVVSNWDVSLRHVLAVAGLTHLLDGVVVSAEAGARKPSPVIFERALGLVGAEPAEALHVGDTVEEDIAGARNAGVPAVLLRRDGGPGPAGVETIRSLAQLPALLA